MLLTCDIDGNDGDVETIMVGWDGAEYSLELCAKHRDEVANFLGGYLNVARRGARSPRRRSSTSKGAAKPVAKTVPVAKAGLSEIRQWGHANGYKVSDRGRISGELRSAFDAAH